MKWDIMQSTLLQEENLASPNLVGALHEVFPNFLQTGDGSPPLQNALL